MEDIHDIKGLVPLPHGLWWLWLLLLAAAIAFVLWLRKRRRPTIATGTVAPSSAYDVAMRALQQLREDNPPVEEFYTRLSDIVRHYLESQLACTHPSARPKNFCMKFPATMRSPPNTGNCLARFSRSPTS